MVQKGEVNFEMEDYSAATENMLLAATALGYSSLWLDSIYFDESKQKAALAVLGAPANYHLRVVLPVGVPDGEGTRREKLPFNERVSYVKFGGNRI
jgi:nitroreductase